MPQTQGRHPDCSKPLCMVQLGIPDWACVLKRHQSHSLTCVLRLLIYHTHPTGLLLCREVGMRSGMEHLSQKDLKNHGKDFGCQDCALGSFHTCSWAAHHRYQWGARPGVLLTLSTPVLATPLPQLRVKFTLRTSPA